MLGAIYIGLSGMQAFSRGLQIISNNVTNMNTSGFKATSVTFADAFNRGGLGSFHAGRNGQNFGSGVHLGSRSLDFSEGEFRQSGGELDLAIKGDGFLVLSNQGRTYYARTGQFTVDEDSYVSLLGNNYRLNVVDDSGNVSPVNIENYRTSPPETTRNITLRGNITADADATTAVVSDIAIYDVRGTRHVWKVTVSRAPAETPPVPNKWIVTVTNESGATVGTPQNLQFDLAGGVEDPSTLTFSYTSETGETIDVDLDFSDVDNFNSGTTSTLRAADVDGRGTGTITKIGITEDGRLQLTYSNEETVDLGAVAVATFRDLQRLEQIGNGMFRNNGSEVSLLRSDTDGAGVLVSKQIEASNVDLAQQFGDLILIQRGFQASSQVVSVSNDMIQQLFGIRGQG